MFILSQTILMTGMLYCTYALLTVFLYRVIRYTRILLFCFGSLCVQSLLYAYSTARAFPRVPQRAVHFRSQRRSRFVFALSFCPISYFRLLRWTSPELDCGVDSPSIPIVFLRKTRFLRKTLVVQTYGATYLWKGWTLYTPAILQRFLAQK